jgi:hypothetical protein
MYSNGIHVEGKLDLTLMMTLLIRAVGGDDTLAKFKTSTLQPPRIS